MKCESITEALDRQVTDVDVGYADPQEPPCQRKGTQKGTFRLGLIGTQRPFANYTDAQP